MRMFVLGLLALVSCAAPQPQAPPLGVAPAPSPPPMTEIQKRDATMLTEIVGSTDALSIIRRHAAANVRDGLAPPPSPDFRPRPNLTRQGNRVAAEVGRLQDLQTAASNERNYARRAAMNQEARQQQRAADEAYCRSLAGEVGTIGVPPMESVARQAIGMQQPYERTAYRSCMLGFARDRAWINAQ